jgi:hypothetical protein
MDLTRTEVRATPASICRCCQDDDDGAHSAPCEWCYSEWEEQYGWPGLDEAVPVCRVTPPAASLDCQGCVNQMWASDRNRWGCEQDGFDRTEDKVSITEPSDDRPV